MKTKIAIAAMAFDIGGCERALISFLRYLDKEKYDVDLYVWSNDGPLRSELPNEINTIVYKKPRRLIECFEHPICFFWRVAYKVASPWLKHAYQKNILNARALYSPDTKYDIAIAYHMPWAFSTFFIFDKVKAKSKILWLHGDIANEDSTGSGIGRYYRCFDRIVAVSERTKNIFLTYYPELEKKIIVCPNFVDRKHILEMASGGATFKDRFNGIRVLSVGRLSKEKGFDLAIEACSKLLSNGYKVKWYFAGDGGELCNLKRITLQMNLCDNIVFLGSIDNPYAYVRDCDIYVQPSRFESYGITVHEAKCFCKPIVVTKCGAELQIKDGETGIVCEISSKAIFNALKGLIDSERKRIILNENLKREMLTYTDNSAKIDSVLMDE